MKRNWLTVAIVSSLGFMGVATYGIYSISQRVSYEALNYSVLLLDSIGVTFRVNFLITNPSSFNLQVWNQDYDVFVGGFLVSKVTAKENYTLLANNSSILPLDISLKWKDINEKIMPLYSQSQTTAIGDLPVLIKGTFASKIGFFRISKFPFRYTARLWWFLP